MSIYRGYEFVIKINGDCTARFPKKNQLGTLCKHAVGVTQNIEGAWGILLSLLKGESACVKERIVVGLQRKKCLQI